MQRRGPLVGSRWGSLIGGPVRSGGRHYRLVVFPPGIDDRERWLLRLWRGWPFGGAMLAVVVFSVLDHPAGAGAAALLAATTYLGPLLSLAHVARRPRRDICVVHAEYLFGPGTPGDLARCRRLVWLSSTLADAEHALDRGELTPIDFQRIWGDVHAEARVMETVPG